MKATLALLVLTAATTAQPARGTPLTPREQAPQPAAQIAHFVLYDVGDFMPGADFSPHAAPDAPSAAAQMSELIATWCEPAFASPEAAVRAVGERQVAVNGNGAQHAWVDAFLATQRQAPEVINVRVKVTQLPRSARDALGLEGMRGATSMPTADAQRTLAQINALGGTVVTTPEVSAWPRQRANISILNQRAFVTGWTEHRVEPNDTLVAAPHIETVNEGVMLDIRSTLLSGQTIGVTLALELANIDSLEPHTLTLPLSGDERDISLATIKKVTTDANVSLSKGMTAVLHAHGGSSTLVSHDDADEMIVVFVEVTSM